MVNPAQQLLADAQVRIAELLRASPAADLERNLKALLAQTFQKLELVTREEFEVERERLARLQARLDALERHLQGNAPAGAASTSSASAGAASNSAAAAPCPGAPTPAPSSPEASHPGTGTATSPPANPYQLPPAGGR
jgi:BMFP domain-containing protein YqiC